MSNANWDHTDLNAIAEGGWIHEDFMDQIWDISRIPLPIADLVGSQTHDNQFFTWATDELQQPTLGGWKVDGADAGNDESKGGKRIGNHSGILDKVIKVSYRAQNVDHVDMNALAYQLRQRQRELRQDVDANAVGNQGSTESDANGGTPGVPASLPVMMTKFDTGGGGSGGVYSSGAWSSWTPGTKAALTETMIRDAAQAAYMDGGNPSYFSSVPDLIRKLSEYMFTSSSRIATLTRETRGANVSQAMGTVNIFLSDFGSELMFHPNRLQQKYQDSAASGTPDTAVAMLIDPDYCALSYLHGYRVDTLAKTGLADNRQMSVDWSCVVYEPNAHRAMFDLDPAAAVTQA